MATEYTSLYIYIIKFTQIWLAHVDHPEKLHQGSEGSLDLHSRHPSSTLEMFKEPILKKKNTTGEIPFIYHI